ncbi:SDR family oxidoreductase [Limnohabitans planktonicus]|uniref:SDR family oxidoreductase n=1 Tax=Limnohabitans planktonicus TaxID=540060 RepID=UPI003B848624
MDYARTGRRIHTVEPAYVDTPLLKDRTADERQSIAQMHAMGRMARPQEIAEIVAFCPSIFHHWANVRVNGGSSAR